MSRELLEEVGLMLQEQTRDVAAGIIFVVYGLSHRTAGELLDCACALRKELDDVEAILKQDFFGDSEQARAIYDKGYADGAEWYRFLRELRNKSISVGLRKAGIRCLDDLCKWSRDKIVEEIPGVGPIFADRIRVVLHRYNKRLEGEE